MKTHSENLSPIPIQVLIDRAVANVSQLRGEYINTQPVVGRKPTKIEQLEQALINQGAVLLRQPDQKPGLPGVVVLSLTDLSPYYGDDRVRASSYMSDIAKKFGDRYGKSFQSETFYVFPGL